MNSANGPVRRVILCFVVLSVVVACDRRDATSRSNRASTQPTSQPIVKDTDVPDLELPAERKTELMSAAKRVVVGQPRTAVEAILGRPDRVNRPLRHKENAASGSDTFAKYILRQYRRDLVNEVQDEWIVIGYDRSDLVMSIWVKTRDPNTGKAVLYKLERGTPSNY